MLSLFKLRSQGVAEYEVSGYINTNAPTFFKMMCGEFVKMIRKAHLNHANKTVYINIGVYIL